MDGEMKYFDFEICGVKRKLPYVKIKEGLALASFVCLSDTELIEAVAPELIKRLPPVDYLIRTSGEQRLSNYLLWQLAYTEFYFTDVPWPAFNKDELWKAIEKFNSRDRRYGGVKEG